MHRPFATVRRSAPAAVLAVLGALALAGCSSASAPDPDPAAAEVVREYLDALASGDAAAASALDEHLLEDSAYADRDIRTLRTDEVLDGAERIEVVSVEDHDGASREDGFAEIAYEYTLDSLPYAGSLRVEWDEAESAWRLTEPLIGVLMVQAVASEDAKQPIDFSVPGAQYTADPTAERPQMVVAYPAVYEVSAEFDAALLAAGQEPTQPALVGEVEGVYVDFAVTQLPAG